MNGLSIDPLEAIWITSNVLAAAFTALALGDALRAQRAAVGGVPARVLVARGNVRREVLRLVTQGLLLSIVIPGLFSDRPTPLNPIVLALIAVPLVLLATSAWDYIDRQALSALVWANLEDERSAGLSRIEVAIAENTKLTQAAGDKADAAYHEANSVNQKIANLQREDIELREGKE